MRTPSSPPTSRPGLAARLDAGLNWDLVDVESRDGTLVGKRPALQDSIVADVGWRATPRIALFRAGSFDAAPGAGGEPQVEDVAVELEEHSRGAKVVSQEQEQSSGPSIEDADVIVAGGRGLGAPENFTLAEELARALGGAVGATRAVVDAGWYPYSAQIGQTGKVVSPKLYVALGISGAIQHKVGMQSSNVIVAINKDPERADLRVQRPRRRRRRARDRPEAHRARERPQGVVTRASDFPPPFASREFVAEPTDPVDERIEVGVLIVGAGPAGLACAIRLGQLLEEHPDVAERLGEVPIALVEKGKQAGSHLLSGAVVNPRALRRLFKDRYRLEDMPSYGPVHDESVYVLSRRNALRIPPPPTMRNHGNWIFSLSQLGRWLAERAEEGGTMILPETAAQKLLVSHGRVAGIRTGDKGANRDGEPMGNFEPGADLVAKVTVLAEGTQGHLTGVALDHFGLRGNEPQVWELGVKEVWRVPKPLRGIVHTMGWPLRTRARYREFGGSFIYPMGDDMLTIGMVVGLDYRDVDLSAHDLLQELKTHPKLRKMLEGGERIGWGAKTIPSGGYHALPQKLHAPGLLMCGDGIGLVNIARLKGVHYAIESGRLAAESAFAALQRGATPAASLSTYDDAIKESFITSDLHEVRDMRQVFGRGFFVGGALASAMTVSKGRLDLGKLPAEPDAEQPLLRTDRASQYPAPDGKLTFDKLSSVFLSGNKTRDDQPNHIRIERHVPRDVADMWVHMCPAQVYEIGTEGGDGTVTVNVAPSNCVQCGAITAKGGRLTPPEGGSGPEYTLT